MKFNITKASGAELIAFYNEHADTPVKKFADRKTAERRCAAFIIVPPVLKVADKAPQPIRYYPATDQYTPPIKLGDTIANGKGAMQVARLAGFTISTDRNGKPFGSFSVDPKSPEFITDLFLGSAQHPAPKIYLVGCCPECGADKDQTPAGLEGTKAEQRNFCHNCRTEYDPTTGAVYKAPIASITRSAAIAKSWEDPDVKAARSERTHVSAKGMTYRSVPQAFQLLKLPMGRMVAFRGKLKKAGKLEFDGVMFTVAEL